MIEEIWKPINGFSYYFCSNLGRIKSTRLMWHNHSRAFVPRKHMIFKPNTSNGYGRVKLDGKFYFVHRLVAATFIPNTEGKPQVNHKDGNKLNNHVSNLEWCTLSENMKHAISTGLRKPTLGGWKLNRTIADEIRATYKRGGADQLAKSLNVCRQTIFNIVNKKAWI